MAESIALIVGRGVNKKHGEGGSVSDGPADRHQDDKIGVDVKPLHGQRRSAADVLWSEDQVSNLYVRGGAEMMGC